MLDSAVGAPLLTIEQIVMDTGKRPVERFFTWYNCEQYDHPALVFARATLEYVHGVAAARELLKTRLHPMVPRSSYS